MMAGAKTGVLLPLRWCVLAAAMAAGAAAAQTAAPPVAATASEVPQSMLPECALSPDNPNKLSVEPCRRAPTKVKRRAVAQVIARMPAQRQAPQAPAYGMTAQPAVPLYGLPPVGATGATSPVGPTGPLPIIGCDPGGCRDASGARYNSGAANTALDPHGRPCSRNGPWLQCF